MSTPTGRVEMYMRMSLSQIPQPKVIVHLARSIGNMGCTCSMICISKWWMSVSVLKCCYCELRYHQGKGGEACKVLS